MNKVELFYALNQAQDALEQQEEIKNFSGVMIQADATCEEGYKIYFHGV